MKLYLRLFGSTQCFFSYVHPLIFRTLRTAHQESKTLTQNQNRVL